MKKPEKISNENLSDVSGGSTVEITFSGSDRGDCVYLSPEEYDILWAAGYIDENNKFNRDTFSEAKRCLQNYGYDLDKIEDWRTINNSLFSTPIEIVDKN